MAALLGSELDGAPGRAGGCRRAMSLDVDVRHRQRRLPLDARFRVGRAADRAVRPLGLRQDHAGQRHRRPDPARPAAASPSTGGCWSTPQRGIFVPRHRRRIGYVFQEGRLFPHLTVRQNLLYGRWFTPERRARSGDFDDVVELLGIGHLLDRRPATLVGRREAARRHRPRAARRSAPPADGRAARLARRRAQGRDPALHRAAARRGRRADRLRQPFGRRGRAACDIHCRSSRTVVSSRLVPPRRSCGIRTFSAAFGAAEAGAVIEARGPAAHDERVRPDGASGQGRQLDRSRARSARRDGTARAPPRPRRHPVGGGAEGPQRAERPSGTDCRDRRCERASADVDRRLRRRHRRCAR